MEDIPQTKEVQAAPGTKFTVPTHLDFIKKLGSGAYGCVASFTDTRTSEKVAVKKVTDAFHDLVDAKRILREIKILRHCKHPNIVQILDLHAPPSPAFEDIYIVMELMDSDLNSVIRSRQKLTDEHIQHFSYQILRGMRYLHSAGIIHRDLKPMNILVNKDGEVKVCDLGLSRGLNYTDEEEETTGLTDYVVTRWYRAPEVVLSAGEYTRQIDTWAVGCIVGELFGRKPLFKGSDYIDQVRQIIRVLGTPSGTDLEWLPKNGPARKFVGRCEPAKRQPWKQVYPNATPLALELIDGLLTFNPNKRLTIDDALQHKFFAGLDYEADTLAQHKIDWSFDDFVPKDKKQLQNFIYLECATYHPALIKRDEAKLKQRGITDAMIKAATTNGDKGHLNESFSTVSNGVKRPGLSLKDTEQEHSAEPGKKKQSCCNVM